MPATYLEPGKVFDFTDLDNDAASQLFNEVVGSLAPAFSLYTNDPAKGNRITKIQQDSIGFAQSLSAAVEQNYQWSTARGLQIVSTAIIAIEYDETTRELLRNVQRADALSGARGNSNLQASVAAGFAPAPAPVADDPVAKLAKFKEMLDGGLISQADYDAAKNKVLGL